MLKLLDLLVRFVRNVNNCKKENNICKYEE